MRKTFIKTKNVKGFIKLIYNLKNKPDNISKIGLIYGEPGLGKSQSALYLAIQNDAIYLRGANLMTPKWLLEELARELDEIPRFYTADIFRQCVNSLKSKNKIIIVDEIDYLLQDFKTVETLRDIHDETGTPIILVGMSLAKNKLLRYKHLYDRVSEFFKFEEFVLSDIKEIIKELSEIEVTDEAIKLIHKKATRFRQITNYVDKLEKIASANEINEIDETIVNEVLNND